MVITFTLGLSMLVISGTALAQQCTDNGDGTVTDNNTNLMWQQTTAGPMDWYEAMIYPSGRSPGGHSGWRLPTRNELLALYNSPCKSQLDEKKSYYWSSTSNPNNSDYAWVIYYDYLDGHSRGNKSSDFYVRAVRDIRLRR